jgi:hypothetical protein
LEGGGGGGYANDSNAGGGEEQVDFNGTITNARADQLLLLWVEHHARTVPTVRYQNVTMAALVVFGGSGKGGSLAQTGGSTGGAGSYSNDNQFLVYKPTLLLQILVYFQV